MQPEQIRCLYCDTNNELDDSECKNCGMAMPDCHPHSSEHRRYYFKWWVGVIAVFCFVMMLYLPR